MFLPSQLAEISQRFQPEVEDLRVLLQEEGLPVGSADCLQELSVRLASDPRFRRDVAFLLQSVLGRERDGIRSDEPGSMDVLGVLVVAAAGTRQEFELPSHQQSIRELLRFVIQQRRPSAAPPLTSVPPNERAAVPPAVTSPRLATRPERPSPAQAVTAPDPIAVPSLILAAPEPFWRRAYAGRLFAVLAVVVVLVAGLAIWRGNSKPRTQQAALTSAHSTPSTGYPAASEPVRRVIRPSVIKPSHGSHRPSPRLTPATRQHAAPPTTLTANTPPRPLLRPEPLQPGPGLNQLVAPSAVPPLVPHHDSATVSLANGARTPSTPGSIDVSKVFAHPEASVAAADQVPSPAFHPSDPVLIARNKPPVDASPLQGTVHTGSMGNMAASLMYSPDPEYPAEAIAAGVAGQVTVRAIVGPRGNVIDASVVSGPPLLREAALEAVGRWRYRPYELDGKPVAVATTAIFDFQIPPNK